MTALKMLNVDYSLGKDFSVIISPLSLIRRSVLWNLQESCLLEISLDLEE